MLRCLHAQGGGILIHGIDKTIRQLADGFLILDGAPDDFVINISDVAHIGDLKPAGAQPALHHVKDDHDTGVAQVAIVVDGHAAHVETNLTRIDRGKSLLVTR